MPQTSLLDRWRQCWDALTADGGEDPSELLADVRRVAAELRDRGEAATALAALEEVARLMPDLEGNGWGEWRRHVLMQMQEHTDEMKEFNRRLNSIDQDLVMLKVKSSLWGAVAGAIVVVIMLAVNYLKP